MRLTGLRYLFVAIVLGSFSHEVAMAQRLFAPMSLIDMAESYLVSEDNPTAPYAIDKNETTAYEATDGRNTWIQVQLKKPMVVTGYTIVSGDDSSKNPKTWTLRGSMDGVNWTDICSEGGVAFDHSFQTKSFVTTLGSDNISYTYFRLHILRSSIAAQNGPLKVADWQLFGYEPTFEADLIASGGTVTAQYPGLLDFKETIDKLTDQDIKNKYTSKSGSVWVQYEALVPTRIASYQLTVPLSLGKRNPRSWQLLGSNDGTTWDELDMRINHSFYDVPSNQQRFSLSDNETFKSYDWATYAEQAQTALYKTYWDPSRYYFIQEVNPYHYGYNYWWNAHVMDVLVDGYVRTNDKKYLDRMEALKVGIFSQCASGAPSKWWNTFYDDMEWMGLATLRAYEATKDEAWKQVTIELWDMIKQGWTDVHGGGIMWASGSPNSKNACSNGPALTHAAKLYRLTGEQTYLDWAIKIHDFMVDKLVNPDWGGLVRDGIGNEQVTWTFTYNQGTFMAGCVELYLITNEQKYLDEALRILDIVTDPLNPIRRFCPNGVVSIEGTGDGGLFKGIMMRYIQELIQYNILDEERQQKCVQFFLDNGKSIYDCALMRPEMVFSTNWTSRLPVTTKRDMSVHVSGTMMMEFLSELERDGLLKEWRLERMNANRKKEYRYFRLQILNSTGDEHIQLAEMQLFTPEMESAVVQPMLPTSDVIAWGEEGRVTINNRSDNQFDYSVYSSSGQLVSDGTCVSSYTSIPVVSAGAYVVVLKSETNHYSTKVIVK